MYRTGRGAKLWTVITSAAVFFVFSYPFKMSAAEIPRLFEINLAAAAAPVLGLLFGIYGAAGAAVGGIAAAFFSGGGAGDCLFWAASAFFAAFGTHILWYNMGKNIRPPFMKNFSEAVKYAIIVFTVSVASAFMSAVYFYGNANFTKALVTVLANNFVSAFVIGIPIVRFVNAAVEPIRKAADDMEDLAIQFGGGTFSGADTEKNGFCETERLLSALSIINAKAEGHIAELERNAAEKERIKTENELAERIQSSLTPKNVKLAFRGVEADIFAQTQTCGHGGGSYDCYDFFMADERHAALLIAESSAIGVSAAMFFLAVRQLIRSAVGEGKSPAEILDETSRIMYSENREDMIVSLWLGVLELDTGKLTYSGAAHDPPIVMHGKKCSYLNSDVNIFFACFEGSSFSEHCEYLGRNDMLLLYSGGTVGAKDSDGNSYGADRFFGEMSGCRNLSAKTVVWRILKSVNAFCGTAVQERDMTLFALKINHCSSITVQAEKGNIRKLSDFAESCLTRLRCPEDIITGFKIAIDEAAANVCGYAYPDGKRGTVTLSCLYERKKRRYSVIISDYGVPFNPVLAPSAKIDGTAAERKIGGLGIHIIKELTDDVRYRYSGGKNILTMSINAKKDSAH